MAALLLVLAVLCVVYGLSDSVGGYAPRCMLKAVTGYDCPGCGSQRAFHAMLHGDLAAVWHYNAALFFMVPLALLYGWHEILGGDNRLLRLLYRPACIYAVGIAIIAWWILRNLNIDI